MVGDLGGETSMEDILSSIKRIIAEESDGSQPAARPRRPARPAAAVPQPPPEEADDHVLELSNAVPDPVRSAQPVGPSEPSIAAPAAAPTILSDQAAQASSRSLEALSRALGAAPSAGPSETSRTGALTVEDLARELMKPMLRDWLDTHLPAMVESLVAREIARITGRSE